MSEQQAPNSSTPPNPPNSKAAWEEVGRQFETLGKTIAACLWRCLAGPKQPRRTREDQSLDQADGG